MGAYWWVAAGVAALFALSALAAWPTRSVSAVSEERHRVSRQEQYSGMIWACAGLAALVVAVVALDPLSLI